MGTPSKSGMLKDSKHRNHLVEYVPKHTPSNHPLATLGWTRMAPEQHALPPEKRAF